MRHTITILLFGLSSTAFAQPAGLLQQAIGQYEKGALDSALVLVERSMAEEGESAMAFKLRGDIKQRNENFNGALLDYTRSEKLDPDQPRLYVSRSAMRISTGDLKSAIKDLDKAIALDPNDADAWYNRACANYMGRDNNGALRDLERALALVPQHADALFLRGVTKGELFREEEGLADIEEALRLKPAIVGGLMSAAVLLFEMKQWQPAIERFGEVIALEDEDLKEALYYRADCHYNLEDKESACIDWRRAALLGESDAKVIVRSYCMTDATKIPRKPQKQRRRTTIEF